MSAVICIGSALVDELFFCKEPVIAGTSNPANLSRNIGGVLSNVAFHLSYLGIEVQYVTVIGNDAEASWIKNGLQKVGIDTNGLLEVNDNTGKYVSFLNPDGSLHAAACVDICEKYLIPEVLEEKKSLFKKAELIITDTNISVASLQWVIDFSRESQIPLIIEPVSVAKARKLAQLDLSGVFMITPNQDELQSVANDTGSDEQIMSEKILNSKIKNIWVRKGSEGSVLYNNNGQTKVKAPSIDIVDSTGAGDAALAGWVAAHLNHMETLHCLEIGHTLAFEVLQVKGAVKHNIDFNTLLDLRNKYYTHAS